MNGIEIREDTRPLPHAYRRRRGQLPLLIEKGFVERPGRNRHFQAVGRPGVVASEIHRLGRRRDADGGPRRRRIVGHGKGQHRPVTAVVHHFDPHPFDSRGGVYQAAIHRMRVERHRPLVQHGQPEHIVGGGTVQHVIRNHLGEMILPEGKAVHQVLHVRLAVHRKGDAIGGHRTVHVVLAIHRLHAEIAPARQHHGGGQRITGIALRDRSGLGDKGVHGNARERIHQVVADAENPGRQIVLHPVVPSADGIHRPLRRPFAYLEVEMRPERIARVARQADHLASLHGETARRGKEVYIVALLPVPLTAHILLHLRGELAEVTVDRDIAVGVRHIDHIAIPVRLHADPVDLPVFDGEYLLALDAPGTEVDTRMETGGTELPEIGGALQYRNSERNSVILRTGTAVRQRRSDRYRSENRQPFSENNRNIHLAIFFSFLSLSRSTRPCGQAPSRHTTGRSAPERQAPLSARRHPASTAREAHRSATCFRRAPATQAFRHGPQQRLTPPLRRHPVVAGPARPPPRRHRSRSRGRGRNGRVFLSFHIPCPKAP